MHKFLLLKSDAILPKIDRDGVTEFGKIKRLWDPFCEVMCTDT